MIPDRQRGEKEQATMGRLFKLLLFLVALAALILVGYAVFFDLPAPTRDIVIPVEPTNG